MTVKAHATWSASATSRNWNCAGALALSAQVAHLDVESEAAAWGTACHSLSEMCLRAGGKEAADYIGTEIKTKQHSFEVDEEMADCAQQYIDYVRHKRRLAVKSFPVQQPQVLWIEQRFTLDKLNPPFDAGGTADAVIYNPDEKLLEVIDLKGGRGIVVEVTENKQLRTYALGAMLANPGLDVERVTSTIVQPRAPHKDGRIRSETYHVTELMEWTAELVDRMEAAAAAIRTYDRIKGDVTREVWSDNWLRAGDHCTFCPAAGFCPALQKKATDAAGVWFDDRDAPQLKNTPDSLSPEQLAKTLDMADMIGNWLNAARALATRLAETGTTIPGYHLADKFGHRKFKGDDPSSDLALLGLTLGHIYEQKLRSPAGVEKAIGSAKLKSIKAQFDALIHKPLTGRTLVSSAKSTKPAVKSAAEAFFTAS